MLFGLPVVSVLIFNCFVSNSIFVFVGYCAHLTHMIRRLDHVMFCDLPAVTIDYKAHLANIITYAVTHKIIPH